MNIVQIGCDDCQDEAFKVISENKDSIERLIIIDAMPTAIKNANERYSYLGSKFTAVQCAIGSINGIVKIYHPNDNTGRCAQASLLKDLTSKCFHDIVYTYVPCLTINDFLESTDLKTIDHFFIDIEGLDASVLLDMNFDKFLPNNILCEYSHADGHFKTTDKYNNLLEKLSLYRYKVSIMDRFNMRCIL